MATVEVIATDHALGAERRVNRQRSVDSILSRFVSRALTGEFKENVRKTGRGEGTSPRASHTSSGPARVDHERPSSAA